MSSYPRHLTRDLLGKRLREFRQAAGMSLAEAAEQTDISEAKLSKLERAVNNAVKLPDIFACANVYGMSPEETAHMIELAKGADSPSWFHPYDVPREFANFLELEGAASTLHIYQQEYIDGLFQTERYVAALREARPDTKGGPDDGLRIERQEAVLNRPEPPSIVYVTDEAALRRDVGGPAAMRDQVDHLVAMDDRDHISIYVIPFAAGAHPSMDGAYRLMYFDGTFPTTVYLESLHGSHYENAEKDVRQYAAAFHRTRQPVLAVPIKEFMDENYKLA
ncbi:helix-turn-helix transcriptional regulator [Glycomyces sp. NPDC021274]|uniref:helix-turn-helix domain-containing protein n=1 Tax=Glycomyces sp. NPDC021274 TaxID=3155120 RepID=UPI0034084BED